MERIQAGVNKCIHVLMLNAPFVQNIGLFEGKMGFAIVFAHLYQKTCNSVFYDYMDEILDNIVVHLHKGFSYGMSNGLSGIGWGIEYLLQKNFITGNGVEICEEIDEQIMQTNPLRIKDLSLETGIEGLLYYVLFHIQGSLKQRSLLPFDSVYRYNLYEKVKSLTLNNQSDTLYKLSRAYIQWYENGFLNYLVDIRSFVKQVNFNIDLLSTYPLGIREGLAGWLLLYLLDEKTNIHIR